METLLPPHFWQVPPLRVFGFLGLQDLSLLRIKPIFSMPPRLEDLWRKTLPNGSRLQSRQGQLLSLPVLQKGCSERWECHPRRPRPQHTTQATLAHKPATPPPHTPTHPCPGHQIVAGKPGHGPICTPVITPTGENERSNLPRYHFTKVHYYLTDCTASPPNALTPTIRIPNPVSLGGYASTALF